MQKTKGKRIGLRVPVIGALILLLAVLVVLGAVFLPEIKQKNRMKKTLNAFLAADAEYVLVSDPRYDTGDLLGNDGKEVRLDGEKTLAVREAVQSVLDAGLSFSEVREAPAGSFDTRVFVRDREGGTVQFFVTETRIGFTDGGAYFLFDAKGEAVSALYGLLSAILAEN